MAKTGEILESGDGELREELECEECGETSAIYHTRDGNELLEEGAYDDRELSVDLEGTDKTVSWRGELGHVSARSTYDRETRGTITIDGPDGELTVAKTYRAMLDDDNDLMESGKIVETSVYFREGEHDQFDDSTAEWDVPLDVLESPKKFLEEARESAEADPQVEYEQRQERL